MPSTPTRKQLSRDERLKILTLRETGQTYDPIASKMGCTSRQAHYVCKLNQATPRKGRGRRSKLSEDRIDEVIEWMHASSDNRSKARVTCLC
jgi:transposase